MSMSPVPGGGNPNQAQAVDNRRRTNVLDEINAQKKRLQHGHHSAGSSTAMSVPPTPILAIPPPSVSGMSAGEYVTITGQQKAALQHAHQNSVGYFITQDSLFGNLILPVLPRITDTKGDVK